jgi:hypothetical protein
VNHAATVDLARAALDSSAERFVSPAQTSCTGRAAVGPRARATSLRRLAPTRRASSRRRTR